MADYEYDIGVIGGGAAGLTVASGAAQLGAKTVLIEKERSLGGDCLHYGCVPSKTLIRSAQVYHQMRRADEYGLPKVNLPPVDFRQIAGRIQSVIDVIQDHDSEERFCGLGARVVFGAPRFMDPHTVECAGERISARSWVIATGSSPSVPEIPGLAATPYITNMQVFSLKKLPASMLVLGGGPIAIEMAQAFRRLGSEVTVIQREGQILPKEDRDMAEAVLGALASEGVRFILNADTLSVRDTGEARELTVSSGGATQTLTGETLLVATGRKPNVERLGLGEIGVEYSARGVKVDNRLRTTVKHIYAAGDVNGGYQFTHAAGYEGGVVVANAVFRLPRKVDYTHIPWCTYSDPELASIGLNEQAAAARGIRYTVWIEPFRSNDRALAEGETTGRIKLLLDARERPLGVQILGPQAGELISEWVAVMNGGVKLSTLAGAIHPYPTLGEINKRVAGAVFSGRIFSDRVRKGLKFFFDLKGRACGPE
jgi:pyruvate/2-oxoglutarate dehydrogenase complex dihydrolipoamide dehydrogenase (E3) component